MIMSEPVNASENPVSMVKDNFEFFLNQASTPFAILTGENFMFTYANAAYVQLMNGRELLGKYLADAIPELTEQSFLT